MSKVKVKGKEYKLKFTIGFWKKIKEQCEVTRINLETKLNEDFGTVASYIVYFGIFYGLSDKPDNINEMEITVNDIERDLDNSVMDRIEEALIESMTESEKRAVELVKRKQEQKYNELKESLDRNSKKKE